MLKYRSTRDTKGAEILSGQAILRGIAPDGGLYVPNRLPQVSFERLQQLIPLSYEDLAVEILSLFLPDDTKQQLIDCVNGAYGGGKFDSEQVAPVVGVADFEMLELWHGPTCAFKDMALQLLPRLLVTARENAGEETCAVILVATSGDTGKAALEGFADLPGTRMVVYYPSQGVSELQKRQMQTQKGENVQVYGIHGNFDDAQTGVKKLFTNPQLGQKLAQKGMAFSSANSINWGRLCPQIVYYFSAYAQLCQQGKITCGQAVNFCVPTGNFGDILAGFYAKQMGLPVNRLICASNQNRVLTDFIQTGVYNRNRPFYTSISPSMDILISSNLERLLYHLSDGDAALIAKLYADLEQKGQYQVPSALLEKVQALFAGGCCTEEETAQTIGQVFEQNNYLCDPHTAVAVRVYQDYQKQTGDETKTVVLSTASPYKFAQSVLDAIAPGKSEADPFATLKTLEQVSSVAAPAQLAALQTMPIRFDKVIDHQDQYATLVADLGL